MKNKVLVVGAICCLLLAGLIPRVGADKDICVKTENTRDVVWSENFDNYTTGSGLHGQGGWFGWGNSPLADAQVTDDHARSTPNSVEIKENADMVHTWNDLTKGNITFTTWVFVPEDFAGQSYFILLSEYNGDASFWSTQIRFDSEYGVVESEYEGEQLPLITGSWVELRVEIDLAADIQKVYYDGALLTEKSWTDGVSQGGPRQLGGVDLFADGSTPVYYDDITIEAETTPQPQPDLEFDVAIGGMSIQTVLMNIGDGTATNVSWSIKLDGGIIFRGKETTGTLGVLLPGSEQVLKSSRILGFGRTTVTLSATCDEGDSTVMTRKGFIFLFLIFITEE
ncbi:MAG: hypothetical protein QXX20_00475 [Candidatus Thermoplasmatota archaeon]